MDGGLVFISVPSLPGWLVNVGISGLAAAYVRVFFFLLSRDATSTVGGPQLGI